MAMNDNAVLTAARGYIYTAPINTSAPTPAEVAAFDPNDGFDGYESIGHTALDELPEFGFDGGETETRGTWQNSAFRQVVTEVAADYVTFNAHQFDKNTLSLYYGITNPGATPGVFAISEASTTPIEKAVLIVIVDGDVTIAFWAGRTAIRREESISMETDNYAYLPLRATFLKGTGDLMQWISNDTGVNPAS